MQTNNNIINNNELIHIEYCKNISNENKEVFVIILTFFLPFVGLIYTLANWRAKWAKNVFWLVCIYMGAVHVYCPEGTLLGTGADGGRYVLQLVEWHNLGYSLKTLLSNYLVDINIMDLYQQLITYFVSKFTDNGHVLFATFAIIFGFLYSRNIWYILEKMPEKISAKFFILFTLYFLISPIYHINGVRMWTALHVYVYVYMPYLLENNRKRLLWLLITPLIHFSYLYVMLLGYIYAFIPYDFKVKNKIIVWLAFIFFIITLFINSLNLNTVADVLVEYSPDAYSNRIEGYVSQSVLDRNIESMALNNWYVAGASQIKFWCYSLLLIILPYFQKNNKQQNIILHLYIFLLLLGGLANLMMMIPSGGRFQLLAQMFEVAYILLLSTTIRYNKIINIVINLFLILLIIPFLVEIRKIFDFYSITLLFGNFITAFFWENNILLISYIKLLV